MQKHQWFLFFSILLILLIPSVLAVGNNEKILGLKGKDLGKIALDSMGWYVFNMDVSI